MPVSAVAAVEKKKSETKVGFKLVLAVLFIAIVFLSYRFFSASGPTPVDAYGVRLVSDKPVERYIEDFNRNGIVLLESKSSGGLTCNFELAAAVPRGAGGYKISVEEGEQGIFLYKGLGYIKGLSERELVTACNAFVCVASNITCPKDLLEIPKSFSNTDEINIVLDSNGRQNAGRAYAELLGVVGYLQAEKVDVNKDGVLSEFEIKNVSGNFIAVRPYLMFNETCRPQPLHNLVERFEPDENLTVDCFSLRNTIFVVNSSVNRILVEKSNIYLYGDEDHVYREAVIVRDALSPKWIRVLYQLEK